MLKDILKGTRGRALDRGSLQGVRGVGGKEALHFQRQRREGVVSGLDLLKGTRGRGLDRGSL